MESRAAVVELENFRGPMDLLLHLVREQELEITEVDLSRLCDQYLQAVNAMQGMDIDLAGEFLVMASTLLLIKSRAILPREEVDLEEELDPGDELILQLLEYRKYKSLSMELARRAARRALILPRGGHEIPADEAAELEEASIWDLAGAYARLVEEIGLRRRFDTLKQEKPLKAFLREVLDQLVARKGATFGELLAASGGKDSIFGVFLSILELVKSRQVQVEQEGSGAEILVRLRPDRDESLLEGIFSEAAAPLTAETELSGHDLSARARREALLDDPEAARHHAEQEAAGPAPDAPDGDAPAEAAARRARELEEDIANVLAEDAEADEGASAPDAEPGGNGHGSDASP